MTLIHAAVVLEAAVIALLLVVLQFRRLRVHHASANSDTPVKSSVESSKPARWHFGFSRIHADGAKGEHLSPAVPSDPPGSDDVHGLRQFLQQRRRPIRAHLGILFAGPSRRTASRHWTQHDRDELWGDVRDGSRDPARLRNDQLPGTLELLPFAILMVDQCGQIVLANVATQRLFGYRQGEMIGTPADDLIPGLLGNLDAARQAGPALAASDRAIGGTRDLFARRKDGTAFPVEITVNPVSSNGEIYNLAVVIDRTERYELQRNKQELAHLTRVSTMGELAASLAHELNQPLTAILSNVQAAQRFMSADPINLAEVREILRDVVQDNNRASDVICRIRTLAKKGELEAAPLTLAGIIGDVVLLLHSDAIVRGIRVLLNLDPNLPPVHGDRVQLQQVVLNLLLNAFDAMEFRSKHDRVVVVGAKQYNADMVRVAVCDRGPGVGADNLDKIFKPFFTSKREGLGLGLSICRSIVEMHGGSIWAENNSDQGTTLYFTLPTGIATEPAGWRTQT